MCMQTTLQLIDQLHILQKWWQMGIFNKPTGEVFCKHKTLNKFRFNAGSASQINGPSKHDTGGYVDGF